MPANSNAIATVTIQDQDLLTVGFSNLVQRVNTSVTFPAQNTIQYAGYQVVTATAFTNLFPAGVNVAFVYIRNATPLGGTNALALSLTPTGGPATGINLSPGGFFLWANAVTNIGGAIPNDSWSQIQYAAFFGAPVVMEYLFAY